MKLNIFSLSPMHLMLCLSRDEDGWDCHHPAKTNTEADRRKLCWVARVTLTVPFECIYNELKPHWVDGVNSSGWEDALPSKQALKRWTTGASVTFNLDPPKIGSPWN